MENLNTSIIKIRVALQKAQLKKSGKNKFAGFEYFELSDFLPKLNELMLEEGVNDHFSIVDGEAVLELIKGEEREKYTIPFFAYEVPANKDGKPSMQEIQYLGALNTYYKRYLYLNAFGITDGDVIDAMDNTQAEAKKTMASKQQLDIIRRLPEDSIARVCSTYKVARIEDLTVVQASEVIKVMRGGAKNDASAKS